MTFYRIKQLREERNLGIKQLCNDIGLSESEYVSYETGKTDISAEALILLSNYYDVCTDYILERTSIREKH